MIITQMLGPVEGGHLRGYGQGRYAACGSALHGDGALRVRGWRGQALRDWIDQGRFKNATFGSVALGMPLAAALALIAKP